MASKAATVYVIDVGASMGQKRNGRTETDLEFALKYVWDKILATVASGRKTDTVGVVGFRTDGTDNELYSDESYSNITVLHPISQFLMDHVREVKAACKPSKTNKGDGISALVVAISMITKYCRHLKYIKKIILVTNASGEFDPDGLDQIAEQLKNENIEVTILGVDFDDAEYGVKEEGKDPQKADNENALRKLCEESEGIFGTMAQAVEELSRPRIKLVRPVPSFKGKLTLGDIERSDTAFGIDVERYPRTMPAKPPTSHTYVRAADTDEGSVTEKEAGGGDNLQAVKTARAYQVEDPDAPGQKREVDREELEKGYLYGRTVVPISSTDEAITTLETQPGLELLGFVPADSYRRYFGLSKTSVIIGQKANDKAALALSSLIHALYELDSYAVARLVTKANHSPVMVMLAPSLESDFECLIDVELPFAEDVRPYQFPPLGKVKSITGKTLDKHYLIPTAEMEKSMSEYVDMMDLSSFGKDEDGEPAEYAPVDDTFSPIVHRVNHTIQQRALNPKAPLPEPYEILVKYQHPPAELVEKSQKQLDKLISTCNVKKVPPKTKGKREREQPKPKSGLDVDELLGGKPATKKIKISLDNAIPEFKRKLQGNEGDIDDVHDAARQMLSLVKELITYSMADTNYPRACEMLQVMRSELIDFDEPGIYNESIRGLKNAIVKGELDGDRMDMWKEIRNNRLGLVTTKEAQDRSDVTEEEARNFLWETEKQAA